MKHVILALEWYDRLMHEGIADYAFEHGWYLNSDMLRSMGTIPSGWRGDGIISHPFYGRFNQFLLESNAPTVVVQNRGTSLPFPLVASTPSRTAKIAFEHLRGEGGFRHFGMYGSGESHRLEAFRSQVESAGLACHHLFSNRRKEEEEIVQVRRLLESVPHPFAVYCNNDNGAARFVDLALSAGFDVPNEVAVLGTDNTPLVCKCSRVPLSSVDTNLRRVGYEAAALLDRMMAGEPAPTEPTYIEPIGVVERASTDTLAAASPHVRKAIEIMREELANGVTITDVVAEVGISHDGLKKAFRREFGKPPSAVLKEMRMKKAAQYLITTDEKVGTVSRMVGMRNEKHFSNAFKTRFGLPPKRYRVENRDKDG